MTATMTPRELLEWAEDLNAASLKLANGLLVERINALARLAHDWGSIKPKNQPITEAIEQDGVRTVLAADNARLRAQLDACGLLAKSNLNETLAKNMPPRDAYSWSEQLEAVRGAVLREINHRENAEAAEKKCLALQARIKSLEGVKRYEPDVTGRISSVTVRIREAGEDLEKLLKDLWRVE